MNLSTIRKTGLIALVSVAVGIGGFQIVRGGYLEGVDAYKRGDYKTALKEFRFLAERGNADAQFNLAGCTTRERAFGKATAKRRNGSARRRNGDTQRLSFIWACCTRPGTASFRIMFSHTCGSISQPLRGM